MKKLLLLLFASLIAFISFGQTSPPAKTRSNDTFTQVDNFLVALKRLGIPTSTSDVLTGTTTSQNTAKILWRTDINKLRIYDPVSETWRDAVEVDLTDYYTKSEIDLLLNNKVDKVAGKGLSTNDYTTAEKNKLSGIQNNATANQTDAYLLNRSNHTGTQPISTVTGLQTALDDKIPLSQKAANNGVATLDGSGKVPVSQLPTTGQEYKGTWNAATNTPTLSDGFGTNGWYYRVTVGGTQNLGSGSITFIAGDDVIYNGTMWQRIPSTQSVSSVNGQTGVVELDKGDIGLGNVDNTSDLNKPISTATQTALNAKENISNKSTSISLGTSNTLYPTQNAVKVYVDDAISDIPDPDPTNLSLGTRTSTTVPINNSNGTGVTLPVSTSSLAGVMSGTDKAKLDNLNGAAYELVENKATNMSVLNNTLYPTTQAVSDYIAGSGVYQNLTLGTAAGQIGITGGNQIQLGSLARNPVEDFSTYLPPIGLWYTYNTTGSAGYPSAAGNGIRVQRASASYAGAFEIWKGSSTNDNTLRFNTGSGTATWNGWETFASREWSNLNFVATSNTGSALSNYSGIDANSITGTNKIYLSAGGTNVPHSVGFLSTDIYSTGGTQTFYRVNSPDYYYYRAKSANTWGSWYQVASREWVNSQGFITSATFPTLNEVLAKGNTTENQIIINSPSNYNFGFTKNVDRSGFSSSFARTAINFNLYNGADLEHTFNLGLYGASTGSLNYYFLGLGLYNDTNNFRFYSDQAPTIGANTIWHSGNFTPGNYLPLTGGTLTGALSVDQGLGYIARLGSSSIEFSRDAASYITANTIGGTINIRVKDSEDNYFNAGIFNSNGFTTAGLVTASGGNSTQWNNAFGWGNHALAGYLKSSDLAAGSGLSLSGSTFSVDNTVVRTTGNQSIAGNKTFTGTTAFVTPGNNLSVTSGRLQLTTTDGIKVTTPSLGGDVTIIGGYITPSAGIQLPGTTSQYVRGDGSLATLPSSATPTLSEVLTQGNSAGNAKITNLATPTANGDATNKSYVDAQSFIEALDEGNGIGYRIRGKDPIYYGNIGLGAVDFSRSLDNTNENGATGLASFAVGNNTKASGNNSFASGSASSSTGEGSFSTGRQTEASGVFSASLGSYTISSGDYSFASGYQSEASGTYSAVFGNGNIALGTYSFATGFGSQANGESSAAFGRLARANGVGSFALGGTSTSVATSADGGASIAIGSGIQAKAFGSMSIGVNNDPLVATEAAWVSGSPAFIVGNGSSPSVGSRKNAYVLYNDGRSEQESDIEVTDPTKGIILRSPDNSRWRITVDNSGNLTTTKL